MQKIGNCRPCTRGNVERSEIHYTKTSCPHGSWNPTINDERQNPDFCNLSRLDKGLQRIFSFIKCLVDKFASVRRSEFYATRNVKPCYHKNSVGAP